MFKAVPMFSGSSGNCAYVKYGDTEFLVDAGVSYRNIRLALEMIGTDISNISAVFVTHEHIDHIKGLEVLAKNNPGIPVYINQKSYDAADKNLYKHMADSAVIKNPKDTVELDGTLVKIFETPHDSAGRVGYRFEFDDGNAFGYATDIGEITPDIRGALYGCEQVILESNHDIDMLKNGPYPYVLKKRILSDHGHLSNDACAEFLTELVSHGTHKAMLAHLSHENNTPHTAYKTSALKLTEAGFTPEDIKLTVAMRSILENG